MPGWLHVQRHQRGSRRRRLRDLHNGREHRGLDRGERRGAPRRGHADHSGSSAHERRVLQRRGVHLRLVRVPIRRHRRHARPEGDQVGHAAAVPARAVAAGWRVLHPQVHGQAGREPFGFVNRRVQLFGQRGGAGGHRQGW